MLVVDFKNTEPTQHARWDWLQPQIFYARLIARVINFRFLIMSGFLIMSSFLIMSGFLMSGFLIMSGFLMSGFLIISDFLRSMLDFNVSQYRTDTTNQKHARWDGLQLQIFSKADDCQSDRVQVRISGFLIMSGFLIFSRFWDTFSTYLFTQKNTPFLKNMIEPNNPKTPNNFGETDFIKIFKMTLVERYHLGLLLERQQCLVRWSNVPSLINFVNFSISKLNFDFGNIASEIGLQKSSFRNRAPGKVLQK